MKKVLALMVAAAFVLTMYVPASAADWDLYGSARVNTFWTDESEEAGDEDGLDHSLQGNSRLGGSVEEGPIGGKFEVGLSTNGHEGYDADNQGNVWTRILAGTVDLGQGELLIGQDYTPVNLFYSNQVFADDDNMLSLGVAWQIREPMVQYSVNGFKIALVENQGGTIDQIDNAGAMPDWEDNEGDADIELPLLEASYHLDLGDNFVDFVGGAQTYEIKGIGGDKDEDIDSYGFALGFGGDIDQMYYRLTGFYGQNINDMGWAQIGTHTALWNNEDQEVVDADSYGGAAVFGMNLEGGRAFELGAGYNNSEPDASQFDEDENAVYYANFTQPLTADGNAFIVPEVGYYDYFDDAAGDDEGDEFYAGLKWQVDF